MKDVTEITKTDDITEAEEVIATIASASANIL